eukprot:TRINITY_DN10513_c0_g1_i1.p1 TRINITY_DN10513_c0_g1~~TRINITY_DN10513_c0_g1_i1.p1  ORF type:complete len:193 (-),score=65.92 TRINITY_DN10513_c0_g1_i1:75-653(-)
MAMLQPVVSEEDFDFVDTNEVKKGGVYVLRNQHPCKLKEVHWFKTGKHGTAKVRVVGIDIFTHRKYNDLFGQSSSVRAPVVKKVAYELARIEEHDGRLIVLVPTGKGNDVTEKVYRYLQTSKEEEEEEEDQADEAFEEEKSEDEALDSDSEASHLLERIRAISDEGERVNVHFMSALGRIVPFGATPLKARR